MSGDNDKLKVIVQKAIKKGITYLQQVHSLDMDASKLKGYMNSEQVEKRIYEIVMSKDFGAAKNQVEFLESQIVDYLVNHKPFDERGQRILKSSLESIAEQQSIFGKFFSGEKGKQKHIGNYLSQKQNAEEMAAQVVTNPTLYSDSPELIEAAQKIYSDKGKGVLREMRYGSGGLEEKKFKAEKARSYSDIQDFLKLSDKYLSAIIGIFGIGLIISSGFRLTGNVVGGSFSFGSGLVGGLLIIIGAVLFLIKAK